MSRSIFTVPASCDVSTDVTQLQHPLGPRKGIWFVMIHGKKNKIKPETIRNLAKSSGCSDDLANSAQILEEFSSGFLGILRWSSMFWRRVTVPLWVTVITARSSASQDFSGFRERFFNPSTNGDPVEWRRSKKRGHKRIPKCGSKHFQSPKTKEPVKSSQSSESSESNLGQAGTKLSKLQTLFVGLPSIHLVNNSYPAALWTLCTADCSPKACTLAAFLCTIAFCTIYESKIHLNEVNQPGADIIIILVIIMT